MANAMQVIQYFSDVLERGQLDDVYFKEDSCYVVADRTELVAGELNSAATSTLFENHAKQSKGKRAGAEGSKPLPIVISLVSLHQPKRRDPGQVGLLLLEASLHRDGRIEPILKTASSPWVPATRLESPSVEPSRVMVGEMSNFWKYSREFLNADISQGSSLSDAIDIAMRMFEKVAEMPIGDYAAAHKQRGENIQFELCYVQELERINVTGALLEVYDYLADQTSLPATIKHMTTGWQGNCTPESVVRSGDGLYLAALKSCGSMSDEHPLAPSQRSAVYAFLDEAGSEVTAVSGPPGTGKTTMLQAIVAGLLTRRALDRAAPPVIVGTSTNNQAVTNIISSFAKVTKDAPGPLDFRWLPQESDGQAHASEAMKSLAVYCPAKSKLEEARELYLVEQIDKSQTYAAYSAEAYLEAARSHFVRNANKFFGGFNDIAGFQNYIHALLQELDSYRVKLLDIMRNEGPSQKFVNLCSAIENHELLHSITTTSSLKDCESLEALDQKLDISLRYAQFWLAVHYFEAAWLLTEDFVEPANRFKSTADVRERYWRQAAALTPCFVMTVYQVPKYFKRHTKEGEPSRFDLGRIDLLIVDEAGQVDTPLGLPSFALAKRALVVGDQKQLAPVWSIDEETDCEVAGGVDITRAEWKDDLQQRGVTCSANSSLMRAATYASSWSYGDAQPGLFLAEHYRCHPEIINYCNDLLYDGLLQPKRPGKASKLHEATHAFLWVDVPNSHDAPSGSSRSNLNEAQTIAQWIITNYAHFFDIYNVQEPDPNKQVAADQLIGVVTPFSAQARLIEAELKKAAQAVTGDTGLPPEIWKKITVGTAHKLQGAERPVVLFSAAYGANSAKSAFIDANPTLMNVAVSRAKDLYIVFAAPNRWANGDVFGVMANFAKRSDGVFAEPASTATSASTATAELTAPPAANPADTTADTPAANPAANPDSPAPHPESASLSVVLKGWRDSTRLRPEDVTLDVRALNTRLLDAGVLTGKPGAWQPSKLAQALGARTQQRTASDGKTYESLEYTPAMQELLLSMYEAGNL